MSMSWLWVGSVREDAAIGDPITGITMFPERRWGAIKHGARGRATRLRVGHALETDLWVWNGWVSSRPSCHDIRWHCGSQMSDSGDQAAAKECLHPSAGAVSQHVSVCKRVKPWARAQSPSRRLRRDRCNVW